MPCYEAASAFTFVTTRIFAHTPSANFVDGLHMVTFPSPPAIKATWLRLLPSRVFHPLVYATLCWACSRFNG
ncbi:MAG TPA: hypothetical protein ENH01_10910 [Nitrospirae bacterium]|nr:hypothetical protein [Nitrospirota bacterium]